MPRNHDHSVTSYPLSVGYDLDLVRKSGNYDVVNPDHGPGTGSYYILVLEGQNAQPSNMNVKQIAWDYTSGNAYSRYWNGVIWSSWVSMGGGGGSMTGAEIAAALSSGLGYDSWKGSKTVYNVKDYGAKGDNIQDDTPFIQAALDACKNAGGGIVYAPKGVYKITYQGSAALGGVRVGDYTTFVGDGMGNTVLRLADIGNNDISGIVRTYSGVENTNIIISNMTIDGNKAGQTGWANVIVFYAGVTPDDRLHSDKDIWVINVEAMNGKNGTTGSANLSRGYGFDPHEVVDRFHAINCRSHDNERDGFVLDGVTNFKLLGNHSYNNGRYGINIITMSFNGLIAGNHVRNNGSNGVMIQAQSYNIVVDSNHIYDNGEQGVRIRRGSPTVVTGYAAVINTYCKISNNLIRNCGKSGINITGACYNTVSNNTIINSSQLANNTYFDVSVDQDDGDTGVFTGAMYNVFSDNYAVCESGLTNKAKAAYREDLTGALPVGNVYMWNKASGQLSGAYSTISTNSKVYDFSQTYTNALDYGAKTDGTDCYVALKSLMDALAAAGGGVAYLPSGTYDIIPGGTVSQGGLQIPSNVTLLGDGAGKTVIRLKSGSNPPVSLAGFVRNTAGAASTNISVIGLTIDCNKAGQTIAGATASVAGLYFGGTGDTQHTVVDVEIKNAFNGNGTGGYGMRITAPSGTPCRHRVIRLNAHDNDRDGLYIDGAYGVKVDMMQGVLNGRHGILVDGGAHDIEISQCELMTNTTNNILVQGEAYDVRVLGGRVKDAGNEGVRVRRGAVVANTYVTLSGVMIEGNLRDGVKLNGGCFNRIEGCTFKDNGQASTNTYNDLVLVADATNIGAATNNVVALNLMTVTTGVKTKYGINETSATDADSNQFIHNLITGQQTALTNLFGASSVLITPTSVAPAGNVGYMQYKASASSFGAGIGAQYDTTNNRPVFANGAELDGVTPNAPPDGALIVHAVAHNGNKIVEPAVLDPVGRIRHIQSKLHGRNVSFAVCRNHATTTELDFYGIQMAVSTATAWTTTRTAAPAADATNKLGTIRRVGYAGSAVAGNGSAYVANSSNYVTRGNAVAVGGFFYSTLFTVQTRSTNSRGFFGLCAVSGAATVPWFGAGTVQSGVDLIGIGWDATDTNLSLFTNDNVSTATKTTLGVSFPVADGKAYELVIAGKPNDTNLYVLVRDPTNGNEVSFTVSADLPRNNIFLCPFYGMYNNTDAVAMNFGVANLFIEQDL